jgi:glutathione S-transferase
MKLYYSPGSCALASHIVLEEIGRPYEVEKVDLRGGQQKSPEYLGGVNWKGKVPALRLDNGEVLTENPAIMSYLADLNPQAGLLAPPGELPRARAQEWLAWCASGIHPLFGRMFGRAALSPEEAEKVKVALEKQLDDFAKHMEGKSFVLGDKFSIADSYAIVFYRWAKALDVKVGAGHKAAVEKLLSRPAVKRALEAEGLQVQV